MGRRHAVNAPRYAVHYRHTYADACPLAPRYILTSETRTRKGVRVCPRCGDHLRQVRVTFALVPWRGDGRYSLADAIATYSRESAADADASRRYAADATSPYVVRTFHADN